MDSNHDDTPPTDIMNVLELCSAHNQGEKSKANNEMEEESVGNLWILTYFTVPHTEELPWENHESDERSKAINSSNNSQGYAEIRIQLNDEFQAHKEVDSEKNRMRSTEIREACMAYYELQQRITLNFLRAKFIRTKAHLSKLDATNKEWKGVSRSRDEHHKETFI